MNITRSTEEVFRAGYRIGTETRPYDEARKLMNKSETGITMEIRRMQAGDVDAVAELERATFSEPWTRNDFELAVADAKQHFLVAAENDIIIAYCGMWKVLDEGQIVNVAVAAAHRRRGVGRRMLRQLIDEGRAEGIVSFTLEVRESNGGAAALYRSLGFEAVGKRPHFYSKPDEAAVLMTYSISHWN